eukprot:TRINITY_DN23483_c0_g1_i1.p1 TRINITY_DN23483_c0_g1~~TRINITY_DN23483_c0_g1_i1.p1  ORF type:complete len:550 (+),score=120.67 TRINITY_DN23483_c0_g1_i1:138-1787(+)
MAASGGCFAGLQRLKHRSSKATSASANSAPSKSTASVQKAASFSPAAKSCSPGSGPFAGSPALAAAGGDGIPGFATLRVHVERAEDLMGMDTRFSLRQLKVVKTLDAYVRLSINDEKQMGRTKVVWKSAGNPQWDEVFEGQVDHPKSYLCVFVCDDDDVFSQDSSASKLLTWQRNCGFLEIPLWELPLNTTVTGWFSLDHPTIVDTGGKLADRQHLKQQREEASEADAEEESAGRIRLTLRLEAAPENEFWAYMQPAPSFEKSLPHLDVPQFIGDVQEIKRLLLERVLLPRFAAISYAISWENPALSTAILLWHWFLCYHTQYLCASFWLVLLMLFLRVDPRQRSSSQRGSLRHKKSNLVTGLVGGTKSLLGGTASAVGGLVSKPLEGVAKGGVKGLAHGVKDGVVGVGTGYGKALVGAVTEVRGGIMGTVDLLRGPSLKEFQQILQLTPGLRDLVRGLQPTVAGIRASLESVDDMFYWGNRRTTATLSIMITVCFTFALLLPYLASIVSRYIFLVLGTLVILAKAQEESVRHLQVVRACAAGKQPDCG